VTTATEIIAFLLSRRTAPIIQRTTGLLPHGWEIWLRNAPQRHGRLTYEPIDALIAQLGARAARPPPPVVPMGRWRALRSLLWQHWDPPPREERGTRWAGGLVFLVVIFVPAFLLLVAAWPFWDQLRQRDAVQSAMAGVNAGVVGILLSALYDPVWISAIHGSAEFGIALAAFGLLVHARVAPVFVVVLSAAAGWGMP